MRIPKELQHKLFVLVVLFDVKPQDVFLIEKDMKKAVDFREK